MRCVSLNFWLIGKKIKSKQPVLFPILFVGYPASVLVTHLLILVLHPVVHPYQVVLQQTVIRVVLVVAHQFHLANVAAKIKYVTISLI
jgi:hypothetical protein